MVTKQQARDARREAEAKIRALPPKDFPKDVVYVDGQRVTVPQMTGTATGATQKLSSGTTVSFSKSSGGGGSISAVNPTSNPSISNIPGGKELGKPIVSPTKETSTTTTSLIVTLGVDSSKFDSKGNYKWALQNPPEENKINYKDYLPSKSSPATDGRGTGRFQQALSSLNIPVNKNVGERPYGRSFEGDINRLESGYESTKSAFLKTPTAEKPTTFTSALTSLNIPTLGRTTTQASTSGKPVEDLGKFFQTGALFSASTIGKSTLEYAKAFETDPAGTLLSIELTELGFKAGGFIVNKIEQKFIEKGIVFSTIKRSSKTVKAVDSDIIDLNKGFIVPKGTFRTEKTAVFEGTAPTLFRGELSFTGVSQDILTGKLNTPSRMVNTLDLNQGVAYYGGESPVSISSTSNFLVFNEKNELISGGGGFSRGYLDNVKKDLSLSTRFGKEFSGVFTNDGFSVTNSNAFSDISFFKTVNSKVVTAGVFKTDSSRTSFNLLREKTVLNFFKEGTQYEASVGVSTGLNVRGSSSYFDSSAIEVFNKDFVEVNRIIKLQNPKTFGNVFEKYLLPKTVKYSFSDLLLNQPTINSGFILSTPRSVTSRVLGRSSFNNAVYDYSKSSSNFYSSPSISFSSVPGVKSRSFPVVGVVRNRPVSVSESVLSSSSFKLNEGGNSIFSFRLLSFEKSSSNYRTDFSFRSRSDVVLRNVSSYRLAEVFKQNTTQRSNSVLRSVNSNVFGKKSVSVFKNISLRERGFFLKKVNIFGSSKFLKPKFVNYSRSVVGTPTFSDIALGLKGRTPNIKYTGLESFRTRKNKARWF